MKHVLRQRLVALCMTGALASVPGQAHACPTFSPWEFLLAPVAVPVVLSCGVALLGLGVAGSVGIGSVVAVGTLPLRIQDHARANRITVGAFEGGFVLGSTLPQRIWDNAGAQREVERAFDWKG